jgi:hypothetical protein
MPPARGPSLPPAAVPESLALPRRASRPQCRQALGVEQVRDEKHPVVIGDRVDASLPTGGLGIDIPGMLDMSIFLYASKMVVSLLRSGF